MSANLRDDQADLRTIAFLDGQLLGKPEDSYVEKFFEELENAGRRRHLRDNIKNLAGSAFRNANVSFPEFTQSLHSSDAINHSINHFLADLAAAERERLSDSQPASQEHIDRARNLVYDFLSRYIDNTGETLSGFLRDLQKLFPLVNSAALFDSELELYFRKQMHQSVDVIARRVFEEIFHRDPDDFFARFLLSRVIIVDNQGTPRVDEDNLQDFFEFLASPSGSNGDKREAYDIERSYLLLHERFLEIAERISFVRDSIRTTIPEFLPNDAIREHSLFNPDFDFHRFFEDSIKPVIAATYEKKLPVGKPQLIDAISTDPDVMLRAVMPERALEELKTIAGLDLTAFGHFLRRNFNYVDIPHDVVLRDEDIVDILSAQMTDVAKLVHYLSSEPVTIRPLDDGIRERCRFLPEIAGTQEHPENCADLHDLFTWSASPEKFFDSHPDRKAEGNAVSLERIRHEARMMLQLFYFYRRHIFEDSFQRSEKSREVLEEHIRKRLQMEVLNEGGNSFEFRVQCELDPDTREPKMGANGSPIYTTLYPQSSSDFYSDKNETVEISVGKKLFRRYPVEEKRLTSVKVTVPVAGKESVSGNMYVYTPQGEIIGRKTFESYLASILRGKTPTDLLRTTFIADDPKMLEALKQFLYESYCSDTKNIKIKDPGEGRSTNDHGVRSRGSKNFAAERALSAGGLYLTTIQTDQKTVSDAFNSHDRDVRAAEFLKVLHAHSHIPFEIQIMGSVDQMLKTLSKHTDVSHGLYGPERFWTSRVFQRLFHPSIYGDDVARDLLGGCRG